MGRFASAATVYGRARPPYGKAFFAAVARCLALSGAERVLDLGTGPGPLALGFAPYVAAVVAIDPEPAMAAAARIAADEAGIAIRVIEARTEDLPPTLGPFDVATIGRALHWMEPVATRAALDRLMTPDGSIVLCRAASVGDGSNPWLSTYETVRRRWSGPEAHPRVDTDAFFAGTRFVRSEGVTVRFTQRVSSALLADRILSMSSSSRDRIGDGVETMRAEVIAAMASFAADGLLGDDVEASAEIFRSIGKGDRTAHILQARPSGKG